MPMVEKVEIVIQKKQMTFFHLRILSRVRKTVFCHLCLAPTTKTAFPPLGKCEEKEVPLLLFQRNSYFVFLRQKKDREVTSCARVR